MTITKTETRTIFDRDKIGIGDIVEFTRGRMRLVGPDKKYRLPGLVVDVRDDALLIKTRTLFDEFSIILTEVNVEHADDIRIIYRHPLNEKKKG